MPARGLRRRERAAQEGTPAPGLRRRERAARSDHLRRLRESWPAFLQGWLRSQHPAAAADAPAGHIGNRRSGARLSCLLQGGPILSGAAPARSLRSPHAIRPLRPPAAPVASGAMRGPAGPAVRRRRAQAPAGRGWRAKARLPSTPERKRCRGAPGSSARDGNRSLARAGRQTPQADRARRPLPARPAPQASSRAEAVEQPTASAGRGPQRDSPPPAAAGRKDAPNRRAAAKRRRFKYGRWSSKLALAPPEAGASTTSQHD
jgi:hypothetical protein